MIEIYKTIEEYPNYEVSNMGNVRRKGRKRLKPLFTKSTGYYMVCLYNEFGVKRVLIHRLVADAFLSNPNNYPVVNHINEDKTDNRVENLEWCTRSYNINYGTSINKIRKSKQKGCLQMDMEGNIIKEWECIRVAQRTLKINNISKCCMGKMKTTGGYKWKYAA